MYRLLVESLLGVRLEADRLRLTPRLPTAWPSLTMHYRHRETFYHITVNRTEKELPRSTIVTLDGREQPDTTIRLVDDRREHTIEVVVFS